MKIRKFLALILAAGLFIGINPMNASAAVEIFSTHDFSEYTGGSSANIGNNLSLTSGAQYGSPARGALGKELGDTSLLLSKPAGTPVNQFRITSTGKRLINKLDEEGNVVLDENGGEALIGYGDKIVVSTLLALGDLNENTAIYFPYYNRNGDETTGGGNRIPMPSNMIPFQINTNGVIYSFGESMSANAVANVWYNVTFIITVGNGVDVQNKIESYLNGELLSGRNFGVASQAAGFDAVTGVDNLWILGTPSTDSAARSRAIYIDNFYEAFYFDKSAADAENILPSPIGNAVTSLEDTVTVARRTGVAKFLPGTIAVDKEELGGANLTVSAFLDKLSFDYNKCKSVRVYSADDPALQTPAGDDAELENGMVMALEASDGKTFQYYIINADEGFKEEIKDLINNSTSVEELQTNVESKKHLIKLENKYYTDNAYRTLFEQGPYQSYSDAIDMIPKSKNVLDLLNGVKGEQELYDFINQYGDIALYENSKYEYYLEAHPLDKEEILRIFIRDQEPSSFEDFIQLREAFTKTVETFDTNNERKDIVADEVNTKSAGKMADLILQAKDLFNLGEKYYSQNAYQTVFEQRPYESFVHLKEMLIKAKTTLDELDGTDWSSLYGYLSDEKDIILYGNSDYSYYSGLSTNERNKVSKLIVAKRPYSSFVQFRAVFSAAVSEYKDGLTKEQASTRPSGGGSSYIVPSVPVSTLEPVETPKPTSPPGKIFDDLDGVEWAEESIRYLHEKEIVSGYNGLFRPFDNVTRAEFVKMLIEAFDISQAEDENHFTDVMPGVWYADYLGTARNAKIIYGYEDGSIGAEQNITRQDMAVMAYRTMAYLNKTTKNTGETDIFADDENISPYARDAVYSMRESEILSGVGNGFFEPLRNAGRAEAAKMIYNMIINTGGDIQ